MRIKKGIKAATSVINKIALPVKHEPITIGETPMADELIEEFKDRGITKDTVIYGEYFLIEDITK